MSTWYYYDNAGTRQGPFTDSQIESLIDRWVIVRQTRLEVPETGRQGLAEQVCRFREVFDSVANWHYFGNADTPQGLFTEEQIEELIEQRVVVRQTLLVSEGGHEELAEQVPRFRQKFDSLPPPVNTPDFCAGVLDGLIPTEREYSGKANRNILKNICMSWANVDKKLIEEISQAVPDPDEAKILAYLIDGEIFGTISDTVDVIDGQRLYGLSYTDGVYVWDDPLIDYILKHHIKVGESFKSHMKQNNWQVPDVDYTKIEIDSDFRKFYKFYE